MKNTPDPSIHQAREREMIEHVQRLLSDSRFMVDTSAGRRAVPNLSPTVERADHGADIKRLMTEMNRPDRSLQDRMPLGQSLDVTLHMKRLLFFSKVVGKIHVTCLSPARALLAGEEPKPLDLAQTRKALSDIKTSDAGPTTIVLVSTSGFELSAHEAAQRTAGRTVILVEPNDAGGWSCHGPVETKALVDLFDPEAEQAKRQRVQDLIAADDMELSQGGVAADKLAAKTQLPIGFIEAEVKSYAKAHAGLTAKRLDGRLVLFRQGSMPPAAAGGSTMPLIDKVKALFSLKGETAKKIAFLSERRTALTQQRDRAYEEIGSLEQKDAALANQFKDASPIARRRITSQLVQLRKEMERRQQMLGVFNQQINVIGTHLHNLELTQQGKAAKLPDSEEMARDAAAAEEMLAKLQADAELADSVSSTVPTGLSDEEQTLYEELERQAGETPLASETSAPPVAKKESPRLATEQAKRRSEPEIG